MMNKKSLKLLGGSIILFSVIGLIFISSHNNLDVEPSLLEWSDKKLIASGDAYQGPWRMNDSEFHYVDDPAIAADANGHLTIIWADQKEQDLFLQRYDASDNPMLDSPVNISKSPGVFSWLPRVHIDPENPEKIYLLWQDIVFSGGSHGGEIFFARSDDAGKTFSDPINLSNTEAGAGKGRLTQNQWDNGSLDIAIGEEGKVFAVWTEYEGGLMISSSDDHGESFNEPIVVYGDNEYPARAPSIAIDQQGNLHLVWTLGDDQSADIHYSVSTDDGETFSNPGLAHESSEHSDAPRVAVDSHGDLHLVLSEGSGSRMGQYNIMYSHKAMHQDQFESTVEISSLHSGQVRSNGFPEIKIDPNDQIFLLWELYTDRSPLPQGLAYTVSDDSESGFASPEVLPGSIDPEYGVQGSRQGSLMNRLTVIGPGEVAVVNSTFLEGESSNIWLNRGRVQQ